MSARDLGRDSSGDTVVTTHFYEPVFWQADDRDRQLNSSLLVRLPLTYSFLLCQFALNSEERGLPKPHEQFMASKLEIL